jgi:hypothetical protein
MFFLAYLLDSTENAASYAKSKSKNWHGIKDNVSEWLDVSTSGLLFLTKNVGQLKSGYHRHLVET